MNSFWKKKVPAFLLTLVMLASLAPAAMAAESPDGQHDWEWKTVSEATCTAEGLERQQCTKCIAEGITRPLPMLAHSFPDSWTYKDNVDHAKRCSICEAEIIGHHTCGSSAGEVTLKATCTSTGLQRYTCTECKNYYTETIPATGHSATLTADGRCKTCGLQVAQVDSTTYTGWAPAPTPRSRCARTLIPPTFPITPR